MAHSGKYRQCPRSSVAAEPDRKANVDGLGPIRHSQSLLTWSAKPLSKVQPQAPKRGEFNKSELAAHNSTKTPPEMYLGCCAVLSLAPLLDSLALSCRVLCALPVAFRHETAATCAMGAFGLQVV